jgi:hypothetical protein
MSGRICLLLWVLIVMLAGCGGEPYNVQRFDVARASWDTLQVQVTFVRQALFGRGEAVQPQAVTYQVFSAQYDTLYAGTEARIPVPDVMLGDEEALLVEVCGLFADGRICDQRSLNASPKRVEVRDSLVYPVQNSYERGAYRLQLKLMRKQYGSVGWEPVERTAPLQGHFRVYVEGGQEQALQVPFVQPQGRFDLSRIEGYPDFLFQLRSRLMDAQEVAVYFDVYVLLGDAAVQLASIERLLRHKSDQERLAEAGLYAQVGAEQVVRHLAGAVDPNALHVFMGDWTYNRLTRQYTVGLEVYWKAEAWAELRGQLAVQEDGTGAVFTPAHRNGPAEAAWTARGAGEVLRLGTLVLPHAVSPVGSPADAAGGPHPRAGT